LFGPALEAAEVSGLKECLVFVWCLLVLTINSLVFDYRDIGGDAAVGTATIPVRLGRRNTIYLFVVVTVALVSCSRRNLCLSTVACAVLKLFPTIVPEPPKACDCFRTVCTAPFKEGSSDTRRASKILNKS
jgi:1,4-dihydroxy-2-naphthoate octaprenyltransferase